MNYDRPIMMDLERLLIVCATEREVPRVGFGRVVVCGVGKTAAALITARELAAGGVSAVISFGVAGALPGSGLQVGDVAVGTLTRLLDEGLDTGELFVSFADGPMPVPGGEDAPTDVVLTGRLLADTDVSFRVESGLIGTVSVCAGTDRLAIQRARCGAIAEAMEGAAVALAAQQFGVPFAEVRGISNLCGPRDGAPFELDLAVQHATRVLARLDTP